MIDVNHVHFTYPGNETETIQGLNFSIPRGEIFGFLGPSGAGKSTTQNILIGILKNYQGHIRVDGRELNRLPREFYNHLGVAFEFPNFYAKLTALENLNFFRSLYSGSTDDPMTLMEEVGLEKDAHQKVAGFSKGMKMRLNFCRAFLNRPRLIFLDEPTSGLDPGNARRIQEIILKKKEEGATFFITTHNMHVAEELCDRVAFIVDGAIKLIDSPRQLKLDHGKPLIRVEYRAGASIQKRDFPLDAIDGNHAFLNILKKEKIETLHTQEATLDDIFIQVTGRRLV